MNNEVFTLHFQLVDTFENYKEFNSLKEVQKFIEGIGESMFVYLDLVLENADVSDFKTIIEYCELWG